MPWSPESARDEHVGADEFASHAKGFPPEFFRRLRPLRVGLPTQRVLDLGTGTGQLARDFARRGCQVTGVDNSARNLEVANAANLREAVRPRYIEARAEATGLAEKSFDVVSAGTSWHLFTRSVAAKEARRVLRPEGRLVIAHMDWHVAPGTVAAATLRARERCAPEGRPPAGIELAIWAEELAHAGFTQWDMFGFVADLIHTPQAWRAHVRASEAGASSIAQPELDKFDAAVARMLSKRFPGAEVPVAHRVFALVAW
jgi:SAM-dependent methyltransferase